MSMCFYTIASAVHNCQTNIVNSELADGWGGGEVSLFYSAQLKITLLLSLLSILNVWGLRFAANEFYSTLYQRFRMLYTRNAGKIALSSSIYGIGMGPSVEGGDIAPSHLSAGYPIHHYYFCCQNYPALYSWIHLPQQNKSDWSGANPQFTVTK